MSMKLLLSMAMLLVPACVPLDNTPSAKQPLVNLQITEDQDMEALDRFMAELDTRQIKVTVIVDDYVATEGCDQLRRYDLAGHEIMVYSRPEEPPGETIELTSLSYEAQKEVITRAKAAIEECLGHKVEGFRSYHFAHNEDTWRILDDLGIKYNLSYVAHSTNAPAGYSDEDWPCPVEGHAFWAVPMHSVELAGQTKAFCDMPFRSVGAAEWEALMKSELTRMDGLALPLKVEFHPYFSANDAGRWNAFLGFLEYAEDRESEFVTVAEMLARMPGAH